MAIVTVVETFDNAGAATIVDATNTRFSVAPSNVGGRFVADPSGEGDKVVTSVGSTNASLSLSQEFPFVTTYQDLRAVYVAVYSATYKTYEAFQSWLVSTYGSEQAAIDAGILRPTIFLPIVRMSQGLYVVAPTGSSLVTGEDRPFSITGSKGSTGSIRLDFSPSDDPTTSTTQWKITSITFQFGTREVIALVEVPQSQWLTVSMSQIGNTVNVGLQDAAGNPLASDSWTMQSGETVKRTTHRVNSGNGRFVSYMDDVSWSYDEPTPPLADLPTPARSGKTSVRISADGTDNCQVVFRGPDLLMPYADRHKGAYAVDESEQMASMQCLLTANVNDPLWVQVFIRLMVVVGTDLVEVATELDGPRTAFGYPVSGSDWRWFQIDMRRSIPDPSITHYQPGLRFYRSPVADLGPAAGTKIYIENLFTPEAGVSLEGRNYLDGDQFGAYWEGARNASSSTYGVKTNENDYFGVVLADTISIGVAP